VKLTFLKESDLTTDHWLITTDRGDRRARSDSRRFAGWFVARSPLPL
jgi:hypothetical protein